MTDQLALIPDAAAQRVITAVRDCTPPGVPSPIQQVVSAKTNRKDVTLATLIMVDGSHAAIEVSQQTWPGGIKGWVLHYTEQDHPLAWDEKRQQWVAFPAESEGA